MQWRHCLTFIASFFLMAICVAWDWDELQRVALQRFGVGAMPTIKEWRLMIAEPRLESMPDKLFRVNRFFNQRLRFVEDSQAWGQTDYWATPLETMGKGEGDCEDFAIAKYYSLRQMGVPDQELRLVYVKARIGGSNSTIQQAHMVLVWYATPAAEPLVLDNLIGEVRPANQRPDLMPIFSFNAEGIYVGNTRTADSGVNRLSRWRDVLDRARQQGMSLLAERKSQ